MDNFDKLKRAKESSINVGEQSETEKIGSTIADIEADLARLDPIYKSARIALSQPAENAGFDATKKREYEEAIELHDNLSEQLARYRSLATRKIIGDEDSDKRTLN